MPDCEHEWQFQALEHDESEEPIGYNYRSEAILYRRCVSHRTTERCLHCEAEITGAWVTCDCGGES